MGAPRDVDPERGEYNDAGRRSGYGRPKKPVHGLPLNTAQVPLVCRSDGPTLAPPQETTLQRQTASHVAEGLASAPFGLAGRYNMRRCACGRCDNLREILLS